MSDIPNSRRSPMEHERDMPDAPTNRIGLHADIINIPIKEINGPFYGQCELAYKNGHRDARHAAAELALSFEREATAAQAEIARLRETNRSLNRRTQQAESVAYNNAGRWKRKLERVKAFADHMLTTNMRVNKREREAKAEVAALRKRVQAADAMADSCETYFESACDMTFVLEKLKAYCDTDAKP